MTTLESGTFLPVKVFGSTVGPDMETNIYMPICVAMMRHCFTTTQGKAIIALISYLQTEIKQHIKQFYKGGDALFKREEYVSENVESVINDVVGIKVYLKDLCSRPDCYGQVKTALQLLTYIGVEIPIKTKEGKSFKLYTNLCDVMVDDDKYKKYVMLYMKRTVLERFLSLDFGYQILNKNVVLHNIKGKYTQRFYLLIAAWEKKDGCSISLKELRKSLKLGDKYKENKEFFRWVVKPAKKELDNLLKKGCSDYSFDYIISKRRVGVKEEEFLEIKIIRLNNQETSSELTRSIAEQTRGIFKNHLKLSDDKIEKYIPLINEFNYRELMQKIIVIRNNISSQSIKNVQLYVEKSLNEFFAIEVEGCLKFDNSKKAS